MVVPATPRSTTAVEAQVLDLVRQLLLDTGRQQAAASVTLDSSLEHDLGLGRLELVDLLARCEGHFELELPDTVAEEIDTPGGWVREILEGGHEERARSTYRITPPRLDVLSEPVSAKNLVEVLAQHAEADPGRVLVHLLEEDSGQGITYGRLYEEAAAVAGGLADLGLARGETVAIMLPTGADFFFAFFGVMLAGGVPVPVYPPTRPDRIEDYVRRQIVILRNSGVRFLISFQEVKAVVQILRVNLPGLIDVTTVDALRSSRSRLGAGSVKPANGAVLQFTSGSTGVPKGIMLSQVNVLANIRAIGTAVGVRAGDALVSWLPLYSDLGLVGCWLFGLYYAVPVTILSPLDFLKRPERWLWAIHDSRGTLSAGPNFAYELCARRIPASTLDGIDLSCWRVAVNAGEPVLPETVERFSKRFASFGFRPESMMPCYGLAESTVALTMPPPGRLPLRERVKRESFEIQGMAELAAPDDASALSFFSSGGPVEGQQVRVVDDQDRPVPDRVIGRLLFRGETTMGGYYRNPEATSAAFVEGGWLDTGDFGYLANGEFYFTGRGRDAITKAGRRMSPLDVEVAVGDLSGLTPGGVVAFGVSDRDSGAEQLVVVAETRATTQEDFRRLEAEIVRVVDTLLGMPPDKVQLVPPDSLPRTANGKIRRNEIRSLYLRGKLRSRRRAPWLQIVRLRWENLGALVALGFRRTQASVVRVSTDALAAVVARAAGVWLRVSKNHSVAQTASRWILRLHGQRFSLQGAQLLEDNGPAVLVANRSGMLDPLVVLASLPREISFAEVTALHGLPTGLRFLLKPLVLGYKDRDTVPSAGAVRRRVAEALDEGQTVVVFPDSSVGTPVLRSRFRLDTFQAGVEKEARLHPTAVRERAQTQSAGDRARIRKVTMLIVRQPIAAKSSANLFEVRNRVRESIGEYHA